MGFVQGSECHVRKFPLFLHVQLTSRSTLGAPFAEVSLTQAFKQRHTRQPRWSPLKYQLQECTCMIDYMPEARTGCLRS